MFESKRDLQCKLPCPICGGREYSWGKVVARELRYVSENASFLQRNLGFINNTKARCCNTCGNVQIFTRDEVEENR